MAELPVELSDPYVPPEEVLALFDVSPPDASACLRCLFTAQDQATRDFVINRLFAHDKRAEVLIANAAKDAREARLLDPLAAMPALTLDDADPSDVDVGDTAASASSAEEKKEKVPEEKGNKQYDNGEPGPAPVDIEFFLPQICHYLLSTEFASAHLVTYLLYRCSRSIHFALKLNWLLLATAEYCTSDAERAMALNLSHQCEMAVVNVEKYGDALHDDAAIADALSSTDETDKDALVDAIAAAVAAEEQLPPDSPVLTHFMSPNRKRTLPPEELAPADDLFALKKDRALYYSTQLDIVLHLEQIASALGKTAVEYRADHLRQYLEQVNDLWMKQSCYFPCCMGSEPHFTLLRSVPNEAVCLNSRDKVPFLIFLETSDTGYKCNSPDIYRSKQIACPPAEIKTPPPPPPPQVPLPQQEQQQQPQQQQQQQQPAASLSAFATLAPAEVDAIVEPEIKGNGSEEDGPVAAEDDDDDTDSIVLVESPLPTDGSFSALAKAVANGLAVQFAGEQLVDWLHTTLVASEHWHVADRHDALRLARHLALHAILVPVDKTKGAPSSGATVHFEETGLYALEFENHAGRLRLQQQQQQQMKKKDPSPFSLADEIDDRVPRHLFSDEERFRDLFGESWEHRRRRLRALSRFGVSDRTGSWDLRALIFKAGDDCRQELLAMQLIMTFDRIFTEHHLPLRLHPYQVLVTSARAGLIEVVRDAHSIHSLKKDMDVSDEADRTLFHLFEDSFGPFGTASFNAAQRLFVESVAAYSLVTYFMQIKDRHNGNILLNSEGCIIHIDFGFFLTFSPGGNVNFESSPFKLTQDYIHIMGGEDGDAFATFKLLVIQGFMAARQHADELCLLVEMMARKDVDMPCFTGGRDEAVAQLRERFCPEMDDTECMAHALALIEESIDNWRSRQYDQYQFLTNGIL